MIKIGAIKKMWKGVRLLLFAYVDDNSSLKSQFFAPFQPYGTKYEMVKIGKGYNKETHSHPRLVIYKWSLFGYAGEINYEKSMVWIGLGFWADGEDL